MGRKSPPPAQSSRHPVYSPAPLAHQPRPLPPLPLPPQQGMNNSFTDSVIQGMAWGTGTAVARHAVDSTINVLTKSDKPPSATLPGICDAEQQELIRCLSKVSTNRATTDPTHSCDFHYTVLKQCQQQNDKSE